MFWYGGYHHKQSGVYGENIRDLIHLLTFFGILLQANLLTSTFRCRGSLECELVRHLALVVTDDDASGAVALHWLLTASWHYRLFLLFSDACHCC